MTKILQLACFILQKALTLGLQHDQKFMLNHPNRFGKKYFEVKDPKCWTCRRVSLAALSIGSGLKGRPQSLDFVMYSGAYTSFHVI